jgi:hypothetical protein
MATLTVVPFPTKGYEGPLGWRMLLLQKLLAAEDFSNEYRHRQDVLRERL